MAASLLLLLVSAALAVADGATTCPSAGGLAAPTVRTIMVSPSNSSEAWVLSPDCKLEVVPVTLRWDGTYSYTGLNCTAKGIQRIQSLPSVQELYFHYNAVTEADFSMYPNLYHIMLLYNNLVTVGGFKYSPALYELDFIGNQIVGIAEDEIPDSVAYLYLSENSLKSLSNFTFPLSIISLTLNKNKFKSINFPIPNGLVDLNLDDNLGLETITNLTMPESLQTLSCVNCKTTTFRGVQLSSQLKKLNFDGSVFNEFEIRQSDLSVMENLTFTGKSPQRACNDAKATRVVLTSDVALCVIDDDVFNAKYPARVQPSAISRSEAASGSASSSPTSTSSPSTTPSPQSDTATSTSSSSSKSTLIIILAVVGSIVCLLIALFVYRRSRSSVGDKYTDASTLQEGSSAKTGDTAASSVPSNEYLSNDVRNDEALIPYRIAYDEIQIVRTIAKGGFGIVHLAKFRGREVAIKQILPDKAKDMGVIRSFMDEIRLCSTMEHPNIVAFIGLSWSNLLDVSVVIEYMPGGDLNSALQKHQPIMYGPSEWFVGSSDLKAKTDLAIDIVVALVYLHSFDSPIIHRDLKARNVLLSAVGSAKLSDFGISREVSLEETMTGDVGTVAWIAPEVLRGERYSEKADIYSLGVLLVELDTARHPYRREIADTETAPMSNTRIAVLVSTGQLVPATSQECPAAIQEVISQCLSYNPANRPSAMDIHYQLRKVVNRYMK